MNDSNTKITYSETSDKYKRYQIFIWVLQGVQVSKFETRQKQQLGQNKDRVLHSISYNIARVIQFYTEYEMSTVSQTTEYSNNINYFLSTVFQTRLLQLSTIFFWTMDVEDDVEGGRQDHHYFVQTNKQD